MLSLSLKDGPQCEVSSGRIQRPGLVSWRSGAETKDDMQVPKSELLVPMPGRILKEEYDLACQGQDSNQRHCTHFLPVITCILCRTGK